MPPEAQPDAASAETFIREAARVHEPDHTIAAMLAPRTVRVDLITLAAYCGEVRRIPLSVSDATLGEIRLQWWRDVVSAGAQGGLSGNPIADEMVRLVARHDLPLDLVLAPLEAASRELQGDAFDDDASWLAYLDQAEGAAMRLAFRVLSQTETSAAASALNSAGRAYAACRLALRLPELTAKGRWPVPASLVSLGDPRACPEVQARTILRQAADALCQQALQEAGVARGAMRSLPKTLIEALLPVALVPAYAKAIAGPRRDALREPAQIAPLTRLFRLWWASKTRRI